MFRDENENPTPYTKDYDYERVAQSRDAEPYVALSQQPWQNAEQHDYSAAQTSGYYPVPAQPEYTSWPNGNYSVPTQQSHVPPSSSSIDRSYPAPSQQGNTAFTYGNSPLQRQQGYAPQPPKRQRGMRTGAILALTLAIILIFGIGIYAGWQYGGSNQASSTSSTTNSSTATKSTTIPDTSTVQGQQEAAIATIEPSVVELDVTTSQGEAIGSGVIIDKIGDIVTNNHVVSGEQTIKIVLSNGKTETGHLIGISASNDLAIVRIQPFANMTIGTIGDSSKLVVGQEVLAVGNPLGITQTATRGIVSALNRTIQEPSNAGSSNQSATTSGATINGAIQTDAAINPGNSGGALINLQGQLIGVPTLTAINTESNTNANGIGFAIPSNTVKAVITQILNQ